MFAGMALEVPEPITWRFADLMYRREPAEPLGDVGWPSDQLI